MTFVKALLIIKSYLNMCNYCWLGKNSTKSCVSVLNDMKEWAKQKSYKYTSKNENNRQQI